MSKLNYWKILIHDNGSESLCGFIEDDYKRRFRDGKFIYTTPIQYRVGNKVVTRSGTIYTLGVHSSLFNVPIRKKFDYEKP